jgi:isopenicillin-N epimerase
VWLLDPGVTFLNHGSFGACPRPVLDAQQRLRDELERQPVRFLARELEHRLDGARAALAAFVGAAGDDLAFVPNTTAAVNAVLRSIAWSAGDEILTTDHAYPACRHAMERVARQAGATVVVARVPFPVDDPARVVDAVAGAVTPRTRLAVVDHVTSPTALVLPVARLVAALADRGVDALIDGAHAPGMVPVDLTALGAAYYAGNCHKWLCAPKGAAFLHVRRDRQEAVRPLVVSHGAASPRTDRSRFRLEFDWTGTDDPTAYLAVPEAIAVMGAVRPGGWPALMAANRALALEARRLLAEALDTALPCPDEMIGALAALPLPDAPPSPLPARDALQEALDRHHGIEVPVIAWPAPPRRLLRISAQIYNRRADYVRLAQALRSLLGEPERGPCHAC